jgi:thiamine-phosphate pyrophosphorylase
MPEGLLLYYITDRTAFAGDEATRRLRLLSKIAEAATAGVDYIQLREKDLPTRDFETLAREAIQIIRHARKLTTDLWPPTTALLINSRTDVALAVEANGVHLPASDVSPKEVRTAWHGGYGAGAPAAREISPGNPLISISCHSPEEVIQGAAKSADLAILAPIFEKKNAPGIAPAGLEALRQGCRSNIPVLALGGVTLQNAESCLRAGAAGIAAIRLFQENNIAEVVRTLRGR